MDTRQIHKIVTRFQTGFLATFPALTAQDLHTILTGPAETVLERLQARYGYTQAQAKAAWNDFVLDHVDGTHSDEHDTDTFCIATPNSQPVCNCALSRLKFSRVSEISVLRLMRLGWGRPAAPPDTFPGFHGHSPYRIH